ncbi:hypothetical protein L0152_15510 [bacterium]|nr:hypothetical protein [bacterium]
MIRKFWPLGLAVIVVMLIASLSEILAVCLTPPHAIWTGMLSRNTADLNNYLSIIEEIRSDGLKTHNLMTAEPHPAFQIRPFHAVLGLLGKIFPGLSPVALLEIGHVIASLFLLTLIAVLVSRLYDSNKDRIASFFLITIGSGLGWLHLVWDPPDLGYSELSTFLALISAPLYQLSLGCVLGIILAILAAYQTQSFQKRLLYTSLAAIMAVLLGFERPFPLIPLCFTIAGFVFIEMIHSKNSRTKLLAITIPVCVCAVLIVFYQMRLIQQIPVYAEWNRQHVVTSPKFPAIFQALGLMIPLAVIGFNELRKTHPQIALIFVLYAVSSIISSKIPIQIQERFLEGLPLSIAVLATAGLVRLMHLLRRPPLQFLFVVIVLALLAPSSWIALRRDLTAVSKKSAPQFMPVNFIEGMKALKKVSQPGEPVLSLELAGNFIIAYSTRPAVVAHRVATSRFMEKKRLVADLFQLPAEDSKAKQLIRQTNARWLFWGPEEKDFAQGHFNPEKASYLSAVYKNPIVTIYRIE